MTDIHIGAEGGQDWRMETRKVGLSTTKPFVLKKSDENHWENQLAIEKQRTPLENKKKIIGQPCDHHTKATSKPSENNYKAIGKPEEPTGIHKTSVRMP